MMMIVMVIRLRDNNIFTCSLAPSSPAEICASHANLPVQKLNFDSGLEVVNLGCFAIGDHFCLVLLEDVGQEKVALVKQR